MICMMTSGLFVVEPHNLLTFKGITMSKVTAPNLLLANAAATTASATTAVATITASLHVSFDSRNFPADVCARYDTFNNPTDILT